ncbi:DNRLRE domain-containing protein [Streptomyces cyaneofuscatus]|uniref:DNRLRE domain-containing protein n=1 Tax=unclassified Streptomyces TaxID=2593676 RepID=UPI000978EF58|nr:MULTISPECIES: DNRLRE domain-containing protein [unclassified Streptomyces]RDV52473.1 sugar-binding protein [Streptomyces sp. IB2014 011-12]
MAIGMATLMALEAAVVVAATGQAVALPREEAPAAPQKSVTYAKSAKDLASAQVAARLSGHRVEALSERTENTSTFANADGSTTVEAASGPIRFQDESGAWQSIDVDLVRSSQGVHAKSHPLDLKLADRTPTAKAAKIKAAGAPGARKTPSTPLVSIGEDDKQITIGWRGALPAPTIEGTTARYVDALTRTDLIVESTRTGFEQYLELKDRSAIAANGSVTLTLDAKGVKARANDDRSITFLDARTGKQVGVLPAPIMWDAAVDPKSGDHKNIADVGLKVTQNGDEIDLTLTPDAAFLADPETKFPVTIDPAVSIGVGFDTFVQQGFTTDVSAQTELKLGNNGSGQIARSFLSFPMAKMTGKQILDAKLNLWNHHSWSCTAKGWEVWDTSSPSTATRWTNQPSWNKKWASTTSTKGFSSACNDGWVSQNITSLAGAWAANGNGTNSLGIRATDESDPYGWKRFNSGNAASNTPYLSVTYNTKPGLASPVSPLTGASTSNTKPTLTGKASDADGNTVRLSYEIWTPNGTTALQTGTSAYVSSGANAPWTPATALAPGQYKWRAATYDGSAWNGSWSAWQTFTVDTTAPATSKITSTDFPAGQWSGTPDGNGNFTGGFTFTPPSSDVKDIQYSLDGGAWTTVATTAAVTRSLTFGAGEHTLKVRTRDAAGNTSAETAYTFSAGGGAALLAPGEGERPARRVDLSAEGRENHTGVVYQYRRGETDTWKDVPAADVRKASDGSALSGWPASAPAGKPVRLTWNITDTFAADGAIDVRSGFTGGSGYTYSPHHTITVDRVAGDAPLTSVGPGTLNQLTGDFTLTETDASAFDMSVTRSASSRRPGAGALQDGQAPIFGKEWTSGTVAELTETRWSYVKKTSATSVAVVDNTGEETGFTATSGNGWKPEPGSEELQLTGSLTGSFTLKEDDGATVTFAKADAAGLNWPMTSATKGGLEHATTTVVSEAVTVDGKKLARPKRIIAPTSAVSAETCTTAPATKGCRALEFVYATSTTATGHSTGADFGDFTGQVKEIRLWSTWGGAAEATSQAIATYRYDASGKLRQAWNPHLNQGMQTQYSYDSAGRITWYHAQSEIPWDFTYGKAGNAATAGEGMLLKATRKGIKQGTADVEEGTASTSVVYDVPLSGTTAPYKMGAADVKAWGQTGAPTDATAVFPADAVPAGHAGSALSAAAYERARITYTDASGREVNSAEPGGHISTTEYDHHGNVVRDLTANNRALALGVTDADKALLADLGINGLATADRAELLSSRSVFDTKGTRELQELGPLHRISLAEDLKSGSTTVATKGTSVVARGWTVNEYDAGRPTDGTATIENQVTKATKGAQLLVAPTLHADARETQTVYDWVKGLSTKTIQDPSGLAITSSAETDAQGRVTKSVRPGSNGSDAATFVTRYWSATGTGACAGRPEWADLPCYSGPAAATTGGGTNPAELPGRTVEYNWWGEIFKISETANGVTRTTLTEFDNAGRPTSVKTTGGVGAAVPDRTFEYDPHTGNVTKTSSPTGGTITQQYDKLGRLISYTDADGGTTTFAYDLLNRPVKASDSAPSTVTYAYDHDAEPRGLVTSTTDSVAGTFSTTYDADAGVASEKLPGGYTVKVREDSTGSGLERVYTRDSDGMVVYSDIVNRSAHGQALSASGWSAQDYSYDRAGRLTRVNDTVGDVCTTRSYTFDKRSNRTGLTTAEGAADADCPTSGGTGKTYTYDTGDRLIDAGYTYDAFGRTTALPGSTLGYFANDLVQRQTTGANRQTWTLDATHRFRGWTTETQIDGAWTQEQQKLNHYDGQSDNPRWIVEDVATGALTRNVESASGLLAATTAAQGGVVLQLTNIHGDVALQLPLDPEDAPQVLDSDEYGNARDGQPSARYGWLGGNQRSSETLTGLTLMGQRVYNPATGRFLSVDPVPAGSPNYYGYPADPITMVDLDGRGWSKVWSYYLRDSQAKKLAKALKGGGSVAKTLGKFVGFIPHPVGKALGLALQAVGMGAKTLGKVIDAARKARGWGVAIRFGIWKGKKWGITYWTPLITIHPSHGNR